MANTDRARGFTPIGTLSGSDWNNSVEVIELDATHAAIGVGDLIIPTADGYPNILTSASNAVGVLGLVVGILPAGAGWNATTGKFGDHSLSASEPTLVGNGVRVAASNTPATLLVATAPDLVMVGQEDGAADPLEHADIGSNVNIVNAGAISNSVMMIDSSTHAATATLPLRLLGLNNTPENEYGDVNPATPTADWKVTFANHARSGQAVGV
jgi:hypothetical protein